MKGRILVRRQEDMDLSQTTNTPEERIPIRLSFKDDLLLCSLKLSALEAINRKIAISHFYRK